MVTIAKKLRSVQPLRVDLNDLSIPDDCICAGTPLADQRSNVICGDVEAIFCDLQKQLINEIDRWPVVVGCMAWLTNEPVLAALARKHAVSILVQKEDFLRPDSRWSKDNLCRLYRAVPSFDRYEHKLSAQYSYCGDPTTEGIRCVGVNSLGQGRVSPRMHHKFLVFCSRTEVDDNGYGKITPHVVWTGSFNATHNGTQSLENAVIIRRPEIATAYFTEWAALLGLSEPCDWTDEWVCPEYRIGS